MRETVHNFGIDCNAVTLRLRMERAERREREEV